MTIFVFACMEDDVWPIAFEFSADCKVGWCLLRLCCLGDCEVEAEWTCGELE